MTQSFGNTRQRAENTFHNIQAPFFAKGQAVEEQDFVTQAHAEKTLRLREARLTKEADDHARATSALVRMRTKKA
ncbi:MAG: hypothetical protein ACK4QP_00275 [Pseudorhizobium sp.]